jgi:hypothetical protein
MWGWMKELILEEMIERQIYQIRRHKVMPGSNVAELYGAQTRLLAQAVR